MSPKNESHAMTTMPIATETDPSAMERELLVTGRRSVARDVVEIELSSADGSPLPTWTPGSHIDVQVENGWRQYSLVDIEETASCWRFAVLHDRHGRGGSAFLHGQVQAGSILRVRGPRNNFGLVPSPRYLFLAGGIGVTPLLSMAAAAERAGASWEFVYCARDRGAMSYVDHLESYGERVLVNADDVRGLFDLRDFLEHVRPDTVVYACGPAPFLDATAAATAHWPSGSLHVERFEPRELEGLVDRDIVVELASSGQTVNVPAGQSVLDAVRAAGVQVLSSCSEGTCGTCEVAVLAGEVEHRDSVLSPEEQEESDVMMICVSRARGVFLKLDL